MDGAKDKWTHFSIAWIIIRIKASWFFVLNVLKIRFPTICVTSKVGMNTMNFCFLKLDRAAILRDPVMDREPFSY